MSPVKKTGIVVRLVQITQSLLDRTYLPYSAGVLEAYATQYGSALNRYTFLPIIYERLPLARNLQELLLSEIVGFSTYIWNINYSLQLSKALKSKKPQTLIVFGGPQIPDQAEVFLREHPWVDLVCHGAGEEVFLQVLEAYPNTDWEEIPGISYLKEGNFVHHPQEPIDVTRIPSPYLKGTFQPIFTSKPKQKWIALWETNRGCPFSCSFCDWGSAVNRKVKRFDFDKLSQEIKWFGKHRIDLVYCCDANFGILKRDIEITEQMITQLKSRGYPRSFYVQNTKNAKERSYKIQKMLYLSGLNKFITLSLQSLNPETLRHIKRDNISLEVYSELQYRYRAEGIKTYTDILVGLPGETYRSFVDGVSQVVDEGQHHIIKFYNVYLLPNAEMAQADYRKKYAIETVKTPYYFSYESIQEQEVQEWQEMVISTQSMSREEMAQMRAFAWFCEIFYFNRKILQIPLLLIMHQNKVPLAELIELFKSCVLPHCEIISAMAQFVIAKARGMILGQADYCYGPFAPGIQANMSVEEFIHSGMIESGAIGQFYQESAELLAPLTREWEPGLLSNALALNQALFMSQLPHSPALDLTLDFNLWEFYQSLLKGNPIPLKKGRFRYYRDWTGPPFETLKIEVLAL